MSLREEMLKTLGGLTEYNKTDHGKFSNWWHRRISEHTIKGGTYIEEMLEKVTGDEELELLWARYQIEREN